MGEGGPPHTRSATGCSWRVASLCSELTWHCPIALSPGCSAKSPESALHSPGTAARREAGGLGGTPVRYRTSDALACLRMQPVSPWQLGMLPSAGPAGSHLPSRHVELIRGLNRGPPSPTPASPLPRALSDPVHRQCCFLQLSSVTKTTGSEQTAAKSCQWASRAKLLVKHHPWP